MFVLTWKKIVVTCAVVIVAVSVGVIGYFGIAPMVAQPVQSPADTSSEVDASDALNPQSLQSGLAVSGIGFGPTQTPVSTPSATPPPASPELMAKLAQHQGLPQGETPSVMVITDTKQLNGNPFFVNSENGDYLLLYYGAKVAVIYRPGTDTIVGEGKIQ